ncbi:MAG: ABC transporter ATP-binding protein [Planctomycetota bacterium]|jgi:lipooligosaccharide transport system ATP-binding protein
MTNSPVIQVHHISKTFGALRAVNGLSFEVPEKNCFGFLGPNGAGKTTMMKMLYARVRRDTNPESSISIFGYDPSHQELSIKYLCGVVPQEDNLDEELNVIQNLMLFARFYNMPNPQARERAEELLGFLELTDKRTARIRDLSGGMKRRLVIARALLNQPRLLILDEPTTGLDPQVRHIIWDKLRQLKKQGTTLLLSTHYMEEAFAICDTILIMHQGQKVLLDTPKALLADHIEDFVLELTENETDPAEPKLFASTRPDTASGSMRTISMRSNPLLIRFRWDTASCGSQTWKMSF